MNHKFIDSSWDLYLTMLQETGEATVMFLARKTTPEDIQGICFTAADMLGMRAEVKLVEGPIYTRATIRALPLPALV